MENQSNSASAMAMVVLPQSVWEGVANGIQQLKEMLQIKTAEEVGKQWMESTEARKMLGVSPKTWQAYRDKRIIPFSQIGRKIYFRRSDIQAFMESHYITSNIDGYDK